MALDPSNIMRAFHEAMGMVSMTGALAIQGLG
jgi:hypothetical protein